jgi:hypothetical protein
LWYSLYGLRVASDVPLLTTPTVSAARRPADLTFRLRTPDGAPPVALGPAVAALRCEHGAVMVQKHAGPNGTWLVMPDQARFHIHAGGRHVDVYPEPALDQRLLGLLLVGQVSIVALQALGDPCLHAGAVVTEQGGIAFLGHKGHGKSTMTAAFLRRGATLLTDDALPLRRVGEAVYGAPGVPFMKVWRETAERALEIPEELPNLVADLEKKLLDIEGRFVFADSPARLRAIYVLERVDSAAGGQMCTISPLSGREALAALLTHTSYGTLLQPTEAARLLPLYVRLAAQASVRVLRYPTGIEYQDAVHAHVLADVGRVTAA